MSETKKILIVAGERDLRELLARHLSEQGYPVLLAEDAQKALQMIGESTPDLIISDAMMPQRDGGELFKEIKQKFFSESIPFIILSKRPQLKEYFETLGVNAFIEKPVKIDILLEKIKDIFDAPRQKQGSAHRRVLFVGRYEEAINKMIKLIDEENCHADLVTMGDQVISKAVLFLPEIIVMESRLFDTGPNNIIRVLRHMPQFKKTPILIYNYYPPSEAKNGEDINQKEMSMIYFVNACMMRAPMNISVVLDRINSARN